MNDLTGQADVDFDEGAGRLRGTVVMPKTAPIRTATKWASALPIVQGDVVVAGKTFFRLLSLWLCRATSSIALMTIRLR